LNLAVEAAHDAACCSACFEFISRTYLDSITGGGRGGERGEGGAVMKASKWGSIEPSLDINASSHFVCVCAFA
jgi:hypothetical protein